MLSNILPDTSLEIAHAIFDVQFYMNNINFRDKDGNTILHLLFIKHTNEFLNPEDNQRNIIYILEKLIDKFPELMIYQNNSGLYPIHLASYNGNLEAVKFMVGIVAKSILFKTNDDMISLHFAILGGHLNLVEYLTNLDLNSLYLTNSDELNAEQLAIKSCHNLKIVKFLEKSRLQFEIDTIAKTKRNEAIQNIKSIIIHIYNSTISDVFHEYSLIIQNKFNKEEILMNKYLQISDECIIIEEENNHSAHSLIINSNNQDVLSTNKLSFENDAKSIIQNINFSISIHDDNLSSLKCTSKNSNNLEYNAIQKLPKLHSSIEYLRRNTMNDNNIPNTTLSNDTTILNSTSNKLQNQIFDHRNISNEQLNINHETNNFKSPSIPISSKIYTKQNKPDKLSFISPRKITTTASATSSTKSNIKFNDFIQSRKLYGIVTNTVTNINNIDIKYNNVDDIKNNNADKIEEIETTNRQEVISKHIIYQDFNCNNEEKILLDYYFTNCPIIPEDMINENQFIISENNTSSIDNNNYNNNNNERLMKGSELEYSMKYNNKRFSPLPLKHTKKINKSPAALKNINLKQMVKKVKNIMKKTNDQLLSDSIHVSDYNDESTSVIIENSNITLLSQPLNSLNSTNTYNDYLAISTPAIISVKKNILNNGNNKIDYNTQNNAHLLEEDSLKNKATETLTTTSPLAKRKLKVIVKLDTNIVKTTT